MVFVNIVLLLLILGLVIFVHELGHFLLAKKAGILCFEFALGMGPVVYQKKKGETVYSLRLLPIGGYVAMAGESIDAALVKVGDKIGVNLDEAGNVSQICLDETIEASQIGTVLELDLYGKDEKELYLKMTSPNGAVTYSVNRNANYVYNYRQERQLAVAERSFENKKWLPRFLTIIAGPLMNFIFAFFILVLIAAIQGQPQNRNEIGSSTIFERGDIITQVGNIQTNNWNDIRQVLINNNHEVIDITFIRGGVTDTLTVNVDIIIQTLGFTNIGIENSNGTIKVGSTVGRAAEAGLRRYDVITSIRFGQNLKTELTDWGSLLLFLRENDGNQVELTILRDGTAHTIRYEAFPLETLEALGVLPFFTSLNISPVRRFNVWYLFTYPFSQIGNDLSQMGTTIGLLFSPNSGVGAGDLTGPIGMFGLVSNASAAGFVSILSMIAFLSINIGIINLLPFPALDGGRLTFLIIEGVTKKRLSIKVENIVNLIGFFLLMMLVIFVAFNDILRLF